MISSKLEAKRKKKSLKIQINLISRIILTARGAEIIKKRALIPQILGK